MLPKILLIKYKIWVDRQIKIENNIGRKKQAMIKESVMFYI
jgi:hypothetical protein